MRKFLIRWWFIRDWERERYAQIFREWREAQGRQLSAELEESMVGRYTEPQRLGPLYPEV